MLPKKEKLSLALGLETHLEEVRKKIDSLNLSISAMKEEKKSVFKKKSSIGADDLSKKISEATNSCVICDKLNSTMERYVSVVFYLWEKESDFKQKLINSKGFCLPHFNTLAEGAFKYLSQKKAIEFIEIIYNIEKQSLERLQDEVHKFTLKFDYRNRGEKWGSEVDAPKRCIEKLSSYVE